MVTIFKKSLGFHRLLKISTCMLLFGLTLIKSTFIMYDEPIELISNETLTNVIYADTSELVEVEAKIELGSFDSEATEQVSFKAIQTVENVYSNEREREGKAVAKKLREAQARLTFDPFNTSNLTEEQFNRILKGTVMQGEGSTYYELEQEHGVNGLFSIAVAFYESGYGKHQANKNNLYGMRGKQGWMSFNTLEENILYFGKLMNKERYFGKSIEEIGKIYCPPTPTTWAQNVRGMMKQIYKDI